MPSSFIAIDTGGTFTDLVAYDPEIKRLRFTKSLTTHSNPIEGILDCIEKTGVSIRDAALFKLGTTLVINTLIERSGQAIALVTTLGFRDVIELARGNRVEPFDLFYRRNPPFVPRDARFEIDERTAGDGTIILAPQREQVEALATELLKHDFSAIAVSFINAYRSPENERQVTVWLKELMPGHFITCGSDLSREWYEYERTSTVVANAYTGPRVAQYVNSLDANLRSSGFEGQFLLMASNGGMLSPRRAAEAPVMLVESGPIGGCIGAAVYAEALGIRDLIAFDMGGTTAKAALVNSGKFDVVSTYYVGGYGKGVPIRTPVVDIVEVGAGGGSIAWVDEKKGLHVGPRSAGSVPGPVAYARGGTEPTVTDANLLLGRLDAARFQGGEMGLDEGAAREAFKTKLADPLGFAGEGGLLELANGVLAIASVTMSGAIKRITVERGKDPRDFTLFAYGGGGPLHCIELARELGMPLVIIPPQPGNFAAVGMLMTDIRRDDGRTFLKGLDEEPSNEMADVYREMERGLRESLGADFGNVSITIQKHAEMRYVGQLHTVRIANAGDDLVVLRESFDTDYLGRYGHLIAGGRVEIVSLHVAAFAELSRPGLDDLCSVKGGAGAPVPGLRKICFAGDHRKIDAATYQRDKLPVGFKADGPAVIEEYGSTTIIGPTDRFEIGRLGEIHVHVSSRKALKRHG